MGHPLQLNHEESFIQFNDLNDHYVVLLPLTMTSELMYSHDDVWLLIQSLHTMDATRKVQPEWWRKFYTAICDQTANSYSPEWDTASIITKMADDLGSFKELLDIWLQVEDAMNEQSVIAHA